LNPEGKLIETVGFGTAINSFFLPGCFIGGLLMDKIGRRQTMTLGFVLWSILGLIIGGAVFPIMKILPLFIVLYGIFNGLGEMGPGVSDKSYAVHLPTTPRPLTISSQVATFLCTAESFPTPLRGHFLGLAAAVGKSGAAIGTEVFIPIQESFASESEALQGTFLIGSALTGALISWFLIPDRDMDLSGEDDEFRRYLLDHGYVGRFGSKREVEDTVSTTF
jgi:MFS family permease